MKRVIRFFPLLFVFSVFSAVTLPAQDLTGIWRGHFRSNEALERTTGSEDRFRPDDRYKMEVQIAQVKNHFEAITYSYKNTEFYGKAEAAGTLNIQSKKVVLKEGKLLEVQFANGIVCMMTCFLQYTKLGNDEYLQGTYYSTNSRDSSIDCGKGSIFLHRVTESDFHKEPFLEKREHELLVRKNNKKTIPATVRPVAPLTKTAVPAVKSPAKTPTVSKKQTAPPVAKRAPHISEQPTALMSNSPAKRTDSITGMPQPLIPIPEILKSRTNSLLKTLTVNHNVIELRIYDDGAIDNDTVSVYYDNKLIISKARLSDQPITVKITVDPSDHPHALVMVAENLGDIPPNTSLLVVRDGEKRYEERIISTEQKNVQVNFVYKKIE